MSPIFMQNFCHNKSIPSNEFTVNDNVSQNGRFLRKIFEFARDRQKIGVSDEVIGDYCSLLALREFYKSLNSSTLKLACFIKLRNNPKPNSLCCGIDNVYG